jgi:hypothetical protein
MARKRELKGNEVSNPSSQKLEEDGKSSKRKRPSKKTKMELVDTGVEGLLEVINAGLKADEENNWVVDYLNCKDNLIWKEKWKEKGNTLFAC